MKYGLLILVFAFLLSACNDWLDVRPETEQKDYNQFSTVEGFFDALTGCYMTMADDDAYGQRLSMSNIESLANLWAVSDKAKENAACELARHEYDKDNAKAAIAAIYGRLFYTVVQANMIIKYAEEKGNSVFVDKSMLKMVEGEAYAIRAYCQFDALRLFGPIPGKGEKQLPYSFATSIHEMPAYYGWDAYVELLKADVKKALDLLREGDPVMEYSFADLNSGEANVPNSFQLYRQSRLNYWAVKGLEARMLLYVGDEAGAYSAARAVIDAKDVNGEAVMKMSGLEDIASKYWALPRECLFYMSKYDLQDKALELLIGGAATSYKDSHLAVTSEMYDDLYAGLPETWSQSYNRKNHTAAGKTTYWGMSVPSDSPSDRYFTVKKYYWDEGEGGNALLYRQLVPMIRMSEVYLIAIETAGLDEANALFRDYMEEHNVVPAFVPDFASKEALQDFLLDEYRREFYAEGVMFYTYKRRAESNVMWYDGVADEKFYVLPLSETEYNPNKL